MFTWNRHKATKQHGNQIENEYILITFTTSWTEKMLTHKTVKCRWRHADDSSACVCSWICRLCKVILIRSERWVICLIRRWFIATREIIYATLRMYSFMDIEKMILNCVWFGCGQMNNSKKKKIAFLTASVQTNSTVDNSKWVVIDFAFMCEISTKAM